eukprot:TRINITY_DN17068_c0_g3_i1.p1 TRINITY_DN17068_c0_g3~~TRINITY_DN17068_c0_g3_i1.p1  ORF type:complete len:111 (-),score=14.65 TRINITY_DN17068_c0_g3_i1:67-399(-)
MILRRLCLGTWTSSFFSQEDEEAFRQSLEPDLLSSTLWVCAACTFFSTFFILIWAFRSDSCVRTLNIVHGVTVLSLSITFILAILARECKAAQAIRWETVAFVYVLLLLS